MSPLHVLPFLLLSQLLAAAAPPDPFADHDKAVHVLPWEWMRDPYIYRHGSTYFLTATRLDHILWGTQGIEFWSSKNLAQWESVGVPWTIDRSSWLPNLPHAKDQELAIVDPEIYFMDDQWVAVHSTNLRRANLLISNGGEYNDDYREPFGQNFGDRQAPSIFTDSDGSRWLLWGCAKTAKLTKDLSGFASDEIEIGPSDRALGIGGCTLRKIGATYVLFGTAWSTDKPDQGTYNLYYCTSDRLEGPYGPRQFAGRFCGHGTPFQDTQGRWWTTAFPNGTHESNATKGQQLCAEKKAWTINPNGLTLVPLEVKLSPTGELQIRAKDSRYANPGTEESQDFASIKR